MKDKTTRNGSTRTAGEANTLRTGEKPRMRRLYLVLILALALSVSLAGCLGFGEDDELESTADGDGEQQTRDDRDDPADDEEPANEEADADEGPHIRSTWHNDTIFGGSVPDHWCATACFAPLTFDVTQEATALVVEAGWEENADVYVTVNNPEDPECSLVPPTCENTASEAGGSPIVLTLTGEELDVTGEWELNAWVDSAVPSEVEVTAVASVVTGGEAPRDFGRLD